MKLFAKIITSSEIKGPKDMVLVRHGVIKISDLAVGYDLRNDIMACADLDKLPMVIGIYLFLSDEPCDLFDMLGSVSVCVGVVDGSGIDWHSKFNRDASLLDVQADMRSEMVPQPRGDVLNFCNAGFAATISIFFGDHNVRCLVDKKPMKIGKAHA